MYSISIFSEWLGASNDEANPTDSDLKSECASLNKPFQAMHFTPRKNVLTPMKTLPFSPSQVDRFLKIFLFDMGGETIVLIIVDKQFLSLSSSNLNTEAIMSTPVCPSAPKPSAHLTPVTRGCVADYVALRTPLRGNQEIITRTPTPFKDALAEMEKKGGPINYIV